MIRMMAMVGSIYSGIVNFQSLVSGSIRVAHSAVSFAVVQILGFSAKSTEGHPDQRNEFW
jgi:hypothetical protein